MVISKPLQSISIVPSTNIPDVSSLDDSTSYAASDPENMPSLACIILSKDNSVDVPSCSALVSQVDRISIAASLETSRAIIYHEVGLFTIQTP